MERDPENADLPPQYANYFQIGYNSVEFLLDFGRQFGNAVAELQTRIVTNPAHAKMLCDLLRRSIRGYEDRFGPIPNSEDRPEESGRS
jgi:hypothetical protein